MQSSRCPNTAETGFLNSLRAPRCRGVSCPEVLPVFASILSPTGSRTLGFKESELGHQTNAGTVGWLPVKSFKNHKIMPSA